MSSPERTLETSGHTFVLKGDGIVRVYTKEGHEDMQRMHEMVEALDEISNGEKILMMLDPTKVGSVSRDARRHGPQETAKFLKAAGIVINSLFGRVIFNFVLLLDKPPILLKSFSTEEEAVEWLKSLD